jgi:energy-converting hydrogenase Eha subunit A
MVKTINVKWLLLISVLTTGAPIWFLSYGTFVNTKIIWLSGALTLLLALLFCLITKEQNKRIFFTTAIGFITATIIKIIIDIIYDSTNHNLLPFEVIYYAIIAFLAATIGVGLGFMIKKIFY